MHIFSKYFLVIASAVALTVVSATDASAHATPIQYEPENSSILENTPSLIQINFSERVERDASSIEVFGPDGARVDNDDAWVAPNNSRLFQTSIKTSYGEGTYTVSWKVLSADDGHFSKGAFIFSVGKETSSGVNIDDRLYVMPRSTGGEAMITFIELLGQALLVALLMMHLFVLLPLQKNPLYRAVVTFDQAYRKRFAIVLFLGTLLVLVGTLSYIVVKSLDLQTLQHSSFLSTITSFISTASGSFTLYRAGLAVLLFVVFLFSRKKIFDEMKGKQLLFVMLGIVVLITLARGRVSHAAASHFLPLLSILVMSLQVFWKTFWVGGVAVFLLLVMPLARKGGLRFFVPASVSFSKLTSIAFWFVGVTGAYIVWLDLKDPSFVLTSEWGVRFIVLSLIGGALFLVRLFHQLYIDRIGTQILADKKSKVKTSRLRWISYSLPLEFLIGVALLLVTSFMVITSPPVAKQTLFEKTALSQGKEITLAEHPFEDDDLLVTVSDEKTDKPVAIDSMIVTVFNEEHGIGPIVVDTEKRFDGAFVFSKKSFSPSEKWKVAVVAEHKDAYDSVSSFSINYPDEVTAAHTDLNRRSFDFFAILNATAACGITAIAFMLYRISKRLLISSTRSPVTKAVANTVVPPLSTQSWITSSVLAALCMVVLWYGYSTLLKSAFQRVCENDGNTWHQMVPTRNSEPTAQISQKGCMAFGGSYFFADEREYRYFFTPITTKAEMQLASKAIAGTDTALDFKITDEKGNPVSDLTVSHERLMHVIIVSEDFSSFAHIHPEQFESVIPENKKNGTFGVQYTFPKAGRYIISVDYAVRANTFSNQFILDVGGTPEMGEQTKDTTWKKTFGEYDVDFSTFPSGYITAGTPTVLHYTVSKNNEPVTDLEPYLGAAMHVAIVKTDLQKFIHTHGEVHPPGTPPTVQGNAGIHFHSAPPKLFGPAVEAHVVFPESGLYQVFGEFKHNGKVILTEFPIRVE